VGLTLKLESDKSDTSIVKRVEAALNERDKELVSPILSATLSNVPWKRADMKRILKEFLPTIVGQFDLDIR
jgi:hypothetical protein